jgi:hypothetical protein
MNCSICDTSLPEDAEFCLRCGSPTQIHFTYSRPARRVEPIADEREQETRIQSKKKREKTITYFAGLFLFTLLAVVSLLLAAGTIGSYFKDFLNTPKNQPAYNTTEAKTEKPTPTTSQMIQQTPKRPQPSQITKTRVVARFVYSGASRLPPVENEEVRAWDANIFYKKLTNKKGWYVADLPCDKNIEFNFGAALEFTVTRFIPCQNKPFGIGLFTWDSGMNLGDNMDDVGF